MKYTEVCKSTKDRGKIIEMPDEPDLYHKDYDGPLYFSVFEHTSEYAQYVKQNGSVEEYDGPVTISFIPFDFDGEKAMEDTRRVMEALLSNDKFCVDDVMIYFSGNKGFHMFLKSSKFTEFHKDTAKLLKQAVRVFLKKIPVSTLDESIYKKTGIIRVANSRHEKTGLYKIPLFAAELYVKSLDSIRVLAEKKRSLYDSATVKEWLKTRGWCV